MKFNLRKSIEISNMEEKTMRKKKTMRKSLNIYDHVELIIYDHKKYILAH